VQRREVRVKRAVRAAAAVLVLAAVAAAVPPLRRGVLARLGAALLYRDPVTSGDLLVLSESGEPSEFLAGEIEASDFYRERRFPRIMVVRAAPTPVSEELTRRGVTLENPIVATLRQLGVPASAIEMLDADEGGTTESTKAIASWVRDHPSRVLVVIGAAHSRRYRRALLRVWPAGAPPPLVAYPSRTLFRVEDWWTSRRTLRDGLFELQKLAWDYVTHPF